MTEFVVIAGLSGAGRSTVADVFEDLGWFVVDNLPTPLVPKFVELAADPGSTIERVALVAGTGQRGDVPRAVTELRTAGTQVRLLFLDAAPEVLVRRYESTRRRHPAATGERLVEAIEAERAQLGPVRERADLVLDTSELNIHQLRARIVDLFGAERGAAAMQLTVMSFGFKHGLPLDADLVLDCRFLPNPHWVPDLQPLTGLDADVRRYVLGQGTARPFLDQVDTLLGFLVPAYVAEGKTFLTIALGCTGGQHRSVTMAEELAVCLRERGLDPTVTHRDVAR